jgi:hypothetical protein
MKTIADYYGGGISGRVIENRLHVVKEMANKLKLNLDFDAA